MTRTAATTGSRAVPETREWVCSCRRMLGFSRQGKVIGGGLSLTCHCRFRCSRKHLDGVCGVYFHARSIGWNKDAQREPAPSAIHMKSPHASRRGSQRTHSLPDQTIRDFIGVRLKSTAASPARILTLVGTIASLSSLRSSVTVRATLVSEFSRMTAPVARGFLSLQLSGVTPTDSEAFSLTPTLPWVVAPSGFCDHRQDR